MSTSSKQPQSNLEQCIKNCLDCHKICLETLNHCLITGGKHTEPKHIKLLTDCVEICQTSANFMIRSSEHHNLTCGVCAEVCRLCAESCNTFVDDPKMKTCVETCKRCAESCHQMASM